jgi:hypothetical protein
MLFALIIILNINTLGLTNNTDHAIYISVAKVNFNTHENEVSISLKVFTDDLEDAIHNATGKREKVVGRSDFSDLSGVIEKYVNQKMEIYLDGKQVLLQVDSCENIGDTTWIHLKGETGSFSHSIHIKNQVLFEVFDTQKNIVEVEYSDEKYYYSLTKDEPIASISF